MELVKLDHARPGQAQALSALLHAAYGVEGELIGAVDFPPLRRTADDIRASNSAFHGYLDHTFMVAVAELEVADDNSIEIVSFAVHPSVFRRGHGSVLLNHVLAMAGGASVSVSTALANTPGVAFYERHGFIRTERWSTVDNVRMIRLTRRASD